MQPLTRDQLLNLPTVVNLVIAARALGVGRTKAYELAQCGQFPCPVLRVGRSYHVPTAGLLELLGIGHLSAHTPDHEKTATPRQ
jgi:predicted DNA-binding transcriptional regulator AlpA